MSTHVLANATSAAPRQQASLQGPSRALHRCCCRSTAVRCVITRPGAADLLRHGKRPQRRRTTRPRSPSALLSGANYDVDASASAASLQSQDEAYLLSPLHAGSGMDSVSLQSVDDVTVDAAEWQKGLLGRMGRFAGEILCSCGNLRKHAAAPSQLHVEAGVVRDELTQCMLYIRETTWLPMWHVLTIACCVAAGPALCIPLADPLMSLVDSVAIAQVRFNAPTHPGNQVVCVTSRAPLCCSAVGIIR